MKDFLDTISQLQTFFRGLSGGNTGPQGGTVRPATPPVSQTPLQFHQVNQMNPELMAMQNYQGPRLNLGANPQNLSFGGGITFGQRNPSMQPGYAGPGMTGVGFTAGLMPPHFNPYAVTNYESPQEQPIFPNALQNLMRQIEQFQMATDRQSPSGVMGQTTTRATLRGQTPFTIGNLLNPTPYVPNK